jgi:hypothetical protein
MNHEFRGDQQGYCHKKADVDLQVQQEGYGRHTFRQVPFKTRKDQKRKPCEQRDENNALSHQHQRIVGEVRPEQKLKEWTTQDK